MRETYQPPIISPAGPPHDHTIGATTILPPSTKFYRNSCVRARAREATAFRFLSFGMDWIRCIAWSSLLLGVMPIHETEPPPTTCAGLHNRRDMMCKDTDSGGKPLPGIRRTKWISITAESAPA